MYPNRLTGFVYDNAGHLMFVRLAADDEKSELYVVTDPTGAPILYFARNGELIKELNWSPFGQV